MRKLVCNRYFPNPLGIVFAEKERVILSQSADWRENPPDIQSAICRTLLGRSVDFGDSHTSDIGHWFRMTGKSGRALIERSF